MRSLIFALCLLSLSLNAGEIIQAGSLKVAVTPVQKVDKVPMGSYLGTYTYPAKHRFTISANVDGFVSEIAVKPYAYVKKGQKLFVLKSPKLLDIQSDYIETLIEFEFQKKEIERLKPLSESGVVASKRYIAAKNKYDQLKASITFKKNILKAYGLTKAQLNKITAQHKANPTLVITSPANVTVSELDVQVGTFVPQGAMLARLVDTTECHFEIDLPWQLTAALSQGEELYSDKTIFTIFAMSPEIDSVSQTRSIDLHEEKGCQARGGASLNVTLYRKMNAWVVSSSALVGTQNGYAVFVAQKEGYRMVPITILAQLEGKNYISAPLKAGDKVAISSVLALKSAVEGSSE